jgi:hypothetical protein
MAANDYYALKRAAKKSQPARSGFCNPANPPEIHGSCRKANCPCDHHQTPEGEAPAAGVEAGPSDVEQPRPLVITEPCVLDALDEAVYHADPVPASHGHSLSHSGAKTLLGKSPAHYQWEREHPVYKDAYDLGSAAHLLVLGEGPQMVEVEADNWMTKAAKERRDEIREAGAIPLLTKDANRVLEMAAALREHPVAGKLFIPGNGKAEASLFWQDPATEVYRRARLDWLRLTGRPIVVDYKTAVNASPEVFGRKAADFGYFSQDPWYRDGVAALDLADPADLAFVFVVQEKDPPYAVSVIQMDDESARVGRQFNRRALDLYAECVGTDTWPSYGDGISTASLPAWFVRAHDEEHIF